MQKRQQLDMQCCLVYEPDWIPDARRDTAEQQCHSNTSLKKQTTVAAAAGACAQQAAGKRQHAYSTSSPHKRSSLLASTDI